MEKAKRAGAGQLDTTADPEIENRISSAAARSNLPFAVSKNDPAVYRVEICPERSILQGRMNPEKGFRVLP
jgi:hypothetical protein